MFRLQSRTPALSGMVMCVQQLVVLGAAVPIKQPAAATPCDRPASPSHVSPCGASSSMNVLHSCNVSIPADTLVRFQMLEPSPWSPAMGICSSVLVGCSAAPRGHTLVDIFLRGVARSCSTAATCCKRGTARWLSKNLFSIRVRRSRCFRSHGFLVGSCHAGC